MRKKVWTGKALAWTLAAAMAAGNVTVIKGAEKGADRMEWTDEKGGERKRFSRSLEEGQKNRRASCSDAEELPFHLFSLETGDLWEEWIGARTEWDGEGTERNPYKISNLSELMGLSQAVAQGENFSGEFFELQSDIHLGDLEANKGSWNPIGWFRNKAELGGEPATAFQGTFDGAGHTISGLKFSKNDQEYSYLGLFGLIEDAEIKNLCLKAEEVSGSDNVAVLAGCVEGNSRIFDVEIDGSVYAEKDAGGIAGEVTGGPERAVIENCIADNIVINSEGRDGFSGGIAGNVQRADLVDVTVVTRNGDGNRIQGKGYVGGITGRQNQVNIYNSYVSGTIGGSGTRAVGGVTGLYESGNLIVSQFDGKLGRTGNGIAAHEGTFIGTREARNGFTYGTGKNDHAAFLFAGTEAQAKKVIGSSISDDNAWTFDAHIGYVTDYRRRYVLTEGTREQSSKERFYYEELEEGIQHIITQKLREELYDPNQKHSFNLDHYAPGNSGEPVRGYLVSVPRIDTKNANGTFDNDVAVLTAISSTNNSYYRQIDKEHPSAVAPGCTVTVATAPKNKDGNRYQLAYDRNEPGYAKPPTYIDENGNRQPMMYINGGSYSFEMPEVNTELNAEYVKVTTDLAMTPEKTDISVVQTRTGDRKNPQITTEVRDQTGRLIAKYINGSEVSQVQVMPISIHAEHNGCGSSADRTVLWSIDDTNLLQFDETWEGGYTKKDARIMPNLNSEFIHTIIDRETKAQADNGYQEAIRNTIYTDSAVVTASTNPSTSVDNQAVTGTCRVNVSFQILDQTTLRVEELILSQPHLTFEITRKLTGDRKNPTEIYEATAPHLLDASLNPSQPFFQNVAWKTKEGEKLLTLSPSGINKQSCQVMPVFDEKGKNHSAWIQNIVNQDDAAKKASKGYLKLSGNGEMTETVTATSEDQTHGVVSADCQVTLKFRTEDQTVVHPESIQLAQENLNYNLSYQLKGDINSELQKKSGFGVRDTLKVSVFPDLAEGEAYEPYNRKVLWSSSDPDAVTVNGGTLIINEKAQWIEKAMKIAPYQAEKTVVITAETEEGGKKASCKVNLHFEAKAVEADRERDSFEIVLTKTGSPNRPALTWSGMEAKQLNAAVYPENSGMKLKWKSSEPSILTVTENGLVKPIVVDEDGSVKAEWIKQALHTYPYEAETDAEILVSSFDGMVTDVIPVHLSFTVVDKTHSSGGGSGSGGGSSSGGGSGPGGGSGSGGGSGFSSGGGSSFGPASVGSAAPAGSITGTWACTSDGFWTFSAERVYKGEWAYIYNPYATAGQNMVDWFRFDEAGHMVTGWFTDVDGNVYYLWPVSDGSRGHMVTGWQWVDRNGDGLAECYYFNPVSDGTKGRLLKATVTPDGYEVNADGAWIVDGIVQKK